MGPIVVLLGQAGFAHIWDLVIIVHLLSFKLGNAWAHLVSPCGPTLMYTMIDLEVSKHGCTLTDALFRKLFRSYGGSWMSPSLAPIFVFTLARM